MKENKVKLITKLATRFMIFKGEKVLKEKEKNSKSAKEVSNKVLLSLMGKNKNTDYGKKCLFANVKSYEDYKRLVPLTTYSAYANYFKRMKDKGEKNLVYSKDINRYAMTSGSVGIPKFIPVSKKAFKIYVNHGACRGLALAQKEYQKNNPKKKLPAGRGFILAECSLNKASNNRYFGGVSGLAAASVIKILKYIATSPYPVMFPSEPMDMKYMKARFALEDPNVTYVHSIFMTGIVDIMNYIKDNWELLCNDIEKGIISPEVSASDEARKSLAKYLKPHPNRAEELRNEFKKGFDDPIIPRIWKKMSSIIAVGTGGFSSYTNKMRYYSGNIPFDFNIYGASEGMFASCLSAESPEYLLIPEGGFYEFIPIDGTEEDITTLDKLEVGKDYEVVVTNLSGLYRYRIYDVVKCVGYHNECPLINFMYRRSQLVNIAGEKLTDNDFNAMMERFVKRTNEDILDFSIYPDFEIKPAGLVVFMEPNKQLDINKANEYAKILDEELRVVSPLYNIMREHHNINDVKVCILQGETYALYRDVMALKGASSNQIKPPRLIDNPFKEKFFFKFIEK